MNKNEEDFKKKENSNYDNNSIEYKEKQKQIDTNSLNQLLSVIYDDEFVIMINDLSHAIKIYNKAMIQFINQTKIILSKNTFLEKKEDDILNIPTLFNSIEADYKTFFSTAKVIFKKMKKYRNERLESINKLQLGEKNLKFCFVNVNKNYGSESGRDSKINDKKDDMSIFSKGSTKQESFNERKSFSISVKTNKMNNISNNINIDTNKLYEENVELKKRIFSLEKKIEIIGSNKKNIITNNINNISNFHLQENKNQNEIDLIRENKNIIIIIKNLINILEYEKSPDYSYNKNTFDNMEEIAEHKKEITSQKEELIFIIKKYLHNIDNNIITKSEITKDINDNININNNSNNKSLLSIKQIEDLKKIIEKLENKIKKLSGENQNYCEEINKLMNNNKELLEENKNKEDNDKKKSLLLQNQMVSLVNQIVELKKNITEKEAQINDLQQEQEENISNLKQEIKNISSDKIISEEKMLKLIQTKNKEISSLINERNEIKKEKNICIEKNKNLEEELNKKEKIIINKEEIINNKDIMFNDIKNSLRQKELIIIDINEKIKKSENEKNELILKLQDKQNKDNNNEDKIINDNNINEEYNNMKNKLNIIEKELNDVKNQIIERNKLIEENKNKISELIEEKMKVEEK